jgi:hypothetical protein
LSSLFPDANDSFSEPSSPSTTALASAGDATRNHYQHHRDLGDAVEAIQNNVPLTSHDHSGTGARSTPKLIQANTHEQADTNQSNLSIHHSLGNGTFQALSLPSARTELDPRYVRKDGAVTETITGIKTLDRPVIADLTNAKHNHSSVTQGGFAVNAVLREEVNMNSTGYNPLQTANMGFFRTFNVPANLRAGGEAIVDVSFQANQLQALDIQAFMGPTGQPSINTGTFANNYYSNVSVRWPGAAAAVSGATSGFWFFDGEIVRYSIPIFFQFPPTASVRNNQSLYLRLQVGSGGGYVRWNMARCKIQLEADLGN